jgi:BMFP domain-containing protein YqiC
MSWMMMFILFAVACPMIFRGMGRSQYNRFSRGDRERFDALESELDYRLEEIERLDARVEELESRLDFAERLLARGSEDALSVDSE